MIWAGLIGTGIILSFRNVYGIAGFVFAILCVRAVWVTFNTFPQLWILLIYSCIAAVWVFFLDKVAGAFLAAVGLVVAAHMFGLIDDRPKAIAGEVLIVIGMCACAIVGPSGGIYANPAGGGGDRIFTGGHSGALDQPSSNREKSP